MRKDLLAVSNLYLSIHGAALADIITIRVGFNPSMVSTASAHQIMPDPQHNCDGQGILSCQIGTCYTGISNGYVGCCSVSSCAARTTCMEYNASSSPTCDMNTGGCVVCTDVSAPYCVTITNPEESQFAMYCSATALTLTTNYQNLVTSGSMAQYPASTFLPTSLIATNTISPSIIQSITSFISPTNLLVSSTTVSSFSIISSVDGPSSTSQQHEDLSLGAVVGIAVAAVFVIIVMFLGGFLLGKAGFSLCRKHDQQHQTKDKKNNGEAQQGDGKVNLSKTNVEHEKRTAEVEGSTPNYGSLLFSPHAVSNELRRSSTALLKFNYGLSSDGPAGFGNTFVEQTSTGWPENSEVDVNCDKPHDILEAPAELEGKVV